MIINEIKEYSRDQFNAVATHPLQSWEWGEARKKTGIKVERFGVYEGTKLQEVFTMTIHPLPYTSYAIGYIPRSSIPSSEFLRFIKPWAHEHNILFIKWEPYVDLKDATQEQLSLLQHEFVRSSHPLFPSWTQTLDLTRSVDELMNTLKPKTRYNIKLAEKKGVVVKEQSTNEGFEIFSKLYFETCKRQHYYGHTPQYHQIIWDSLKDTMAHILIASFEDEPLAAYELFSFNKRLYYPYGGSSDQHRNLMATNLIMWEAIKLGKKQGAETFDLWGSLPPTYNNDDSWSGFTRFKEGYGTKFVEYVGSYDLVINHTLYPLYNILHNIRNRYLQIR